MSSLTGFFGKGTFQPAISPPRCDERRRFFENSLLVLLAFYLFVDTLNGLLVQISGLPSVLSALYKQGLLLLVLIFAFQYEPKRFLYCLMSIMTIFVWGIIRFFTVDNVEFLYAFQESLKVIYLFVLVLTLSRFQYLSYRKLQTVLLFALGVVILNVLFSLAGFGLSTYNDFGAKGFFYSGNSVSGVIVISAAIILTQAFRKSFFLFGGLVLALGALALIVGTKSGFLGVFLSAFLIMLFSASLRSFLNLIAILILIGITLFALADELSQQPLFERIVFFYNNGGITRVLFSGRDVKLWEIWPLIESVNFWQMGFGLSMDDMLKAGISRVEFDWIDMQINFGLFLSLLVYIGYTYLFFRLLLEPKSMVVVAALVAFIVLVAISMIAGHILYNGMVTPLWAVLTGAALNRNLIRKSISCGSQHAS